MTPRCQISKAGLAPALLALALTTACGSDELGQETPDDSRMRPTDSLEIEVGPSRPTLISLEEPSARDAEADYETARDWDLAFVGWNVLTNGGVSGSGFGAAFGPLPLLHFQLEGADPDPPFLVTDHPGGAFEKWYAYDGGEHLVYSRYHVYGVRARDRLYKLQLLSYYGEVEGAPMSAFYALRYAEVSTDGTGETASLAGIDGSGGGLDAPADAPTTCIALGSGAESILDPDQAASDPDWDLCFRRIAVSVNGEAGGPGGVAAVDLDAAATEGELVDDVVERTAESELARFDAVDYARLSDTALDYHGDRVFSAFTDQWVDRTVEMPLPVAEICWLVIGADGSSQFLVVFDEIRDSTEDAAGTVALRVQELPPL